MVIADQIQLHATGFLGSSDGCPFIVMPGFLQNPTEVNENGDEVPKWNKVEVNGTNYTGNII